MGLAGGPDEFYERLYARGMADFRTADYQLAYAELHKAAFGFVEEIEKFETAEVYAAIAASRDTTARRATHFFASLPLKTSSRDCGR